MNILVCGAGGQLGTALSRLDWPGADIRSVDRAQLDLRDARTVSAALESFRPDYVINAAAYTDVERAEREPEAAFEVNASAAGELARQCRKVGARLIHVSTDYVFDGRSARPYRPEDPPNPINVYGKSKLEGEQRVMEESGGQALILRTAWVYSSIGRNFVLKILDRIRQGSELRVVTDQVGTPTWTASIADAIRSLVNCDEARGICHFTDAGSASWFELASEVMRQAFDLGLIRSTVRIEPVDSSQYPTAAARPAYSMLDTSLFERLTGMRPRHWKESLASMLGGMRTP